MYISRTQLNTHSNTFSKQAVPYEMGGRALLSKATARHWYSTTCFGVRAIGVPIARQARDLISYAYECVRICARTGARPRRIIISVLTLCARRPTLCAHGVRTCARTIGGDGLRDRIKRVHSVQIHRNTQHSLLNNLNLDGTLTSTRKKERKKSFT